MIQENMYPFLVWSTPPQTVDQAARRIAEQGAGSLMTAPMTRLVFSVFLNYEQFKRAMVDCKFSMQEKFEMKSGVIKTIKITAENVSTKTVWQLIGTEYPQFFMIHNVKLIVAPQETPEAVEQFKDSLMGDEEREE